MIGRITGRILSEELDGSVVVDAHGVGYEIFVPAGSLGRAGRDPHGNVSLVIHTHVREDALTLFGFSSSRERFAFRTLIGVSSVGPKTAIAILSAFPSEELAALVAREDVKRLSTIPGIGKKTAERLVLELRDKLDGVPRAAPRGQASDHATAAGDAWLVSALVNMGYKTAEAEKATESVADRLPGLSPSEAVREALRALVR